jgi:hypothetical protein
VSKDPCEFNPVYKGPSYGGKRGDCGNKSEWIIGANGKWRVCHICSKSDFFKKFRKRIKILENLK